MMWFLLFCLISSDSHIFTTGGRQGTYQSVASAIDSAVSAEYPEIEFEIIYSDGSMQNLERVYEGLADFGIVQSNDLHYAALHHRKYPFLRNRVTAVTALYSEPLHIIVRKDQHIVDPVALSGRRISIGPEGSGTFFVAQAVMITAGIMDAVECHTLSVNECVTALRNLEIDAAFFVSSPFVESSVSRLLNGDDRFEILSLGSNILEKVHKEQPSLRQMIIPANAYLGQAEPVFTVGAEAILICRYELSSNLVNKITRSLFDNRDCLPDHVRQQLNLDFAVKHLPVELHEGANIYYEETSLFIRHLVKIQMTLVLIVIFVLVVILMLTRHPRANSLAYIRLVRAQIFFLIVWVASAYLMFSFESAINEHFGSIGESFWSIATYFLSGLEDMNPITLAGRTVAFLVLATGIGTIAFVTAEVASIFTQNKMRKEVDMQGFKNHVILCNWSVRGERILKELFSPISPLRNTDVGIITEEPEKFMGITEKYKNRVHLVSGDPNRTTTLRKAGVLKASSVIILANDDENDPDGASAQVLLALKKLLENEKSEGADPRLMVEVVDSRYREMLDDAGADTMICGEDFTIGTLAQSAIFPGMTKIYEELLDYSSDNNEFYVVPVSEFEKDIRHSEIVGKSYLEVAERIVGTRSEENPAILVGVKKGSEVVLNPRGQEIVGTRSFKGFDEDDSLILMAYEKPEPGKLFKGGMHKSPSRSMNDSEKNKIGFGSRRECQPQEPGEDQILICNWSLVGEKIVEELHDVCSPARSISIIVLSEEVVDDRAYIKKHAFKENVTFLSGRSTNKNVLKKIGAHKSKSVIVLAQATACDADGANTLTVLSLKRLIAEEFGSTDPGPNILIEALNHRKQEVLIGAGASEIISRDDFTMGILAQSCMYPQISDVFNELLDYDDDSNEIYISPWAEMADNMRNDILEKSFVDLYRHFLYKRNPANPSLLIGIVRGGEFILNPRDLSDSRFTRLREGDGLIFLSYKRPDFSNVI
ncbi:MAG: TAXI family TRAP transporter solute-binding subunit [Bacteroidales bacterium]|nr:TAXI family TRAP transporter solute-binding subunit [Candidatus Latescibacterota bacterium]